MYRAQPDLAAYLRANAEQIGPGVAAGCGVYRFSTRQWKALQRLNYILLGLMTIHALVYFSYEDRRLPFIGVLAVVVIVVVGTQLAGVRKRRRTQAQASGIDSHMALQ